MPVSFDDHQRRAIEHVHGPMLVVAGAGSGKTTVLVQRIAHLIRNHHAKPGEILAVTYTENAAAVLQERVGKLVRKNCDGLRATTFHAYCLGILEKAGKSFGIVEERDLYVYLRRRIAELPLDYYSKAATPGQFLDALNEFFQRCHDELVEAADFSHFVDQVAAGKYPPPRVVRSKDFKDISQQELIARCREIAAVYSRVEQMLREDRLGTFGHMILRAVQLLKTDATVLARERARARFLLMDEFQDANLAQIELAQLLAGPERNVFAVGDPDQAIYRFRGASSAAFSEFARRFPQTKTVVLSQNWRSLPPVLACAHGVISRNSAIESVADGEGNRFERAPLTSARARPAQGQPTLPLWPPVDVVICRSDMEEAAHVAGEIERRLRDVHKSRAAREPRFGVLYRAHTHRDALVQELTVRGIPFAVRGVNVLEAGIVRDALALLRCLRTPPVAESLFRVAALPIFALDSEEVREANYAADRQSWTAAQNGQRQEVSFEAVLRSVSGGDRVLAAIEAARLQAEQRGMQATAVLAIVTERFALDTASIALKAFASFVETWEKKAITRTGKLAEFLEYLEFYCEAGGAVDLPSTEDETNTGLVSLMTVHAAKGMEFDDVFVLRLGTNSFPAKLREKLFEFPSELRKSLVAEGDGSRVHEEEERRLFYVAMTRARDSLTVCARRTTGKNPRPAKLARDVMESPFASGFWRMGEAVPYRATLAAAASPASGLNRWLLGPPSARLKAPSLSASAIEMYERCPLEFKLRRDWVLPGRIGGALHFGSAMHQVLKDYYDAVKAGRPRTPEQVFARFRELLETVVFADPVQRELYLRDGVRQLTRFLEHTATHPAVLHTERPFEIKMGDVLVRGRVDRMDDAGAGAITIVDYKTGTPQKASDAESSLQLSIYALAARMLWDLAAERIVLHNLADGSMVETRRTPAQLEEARRRIQDVADRIFRGEFDPRPAYHCRNCSYRGLCPATEQDIALPYPAPSTTNQAAEPETLA
ncbi:MAG: ATP-dependent helicase [Candidatus Korobacteraceae bacterium]